jgi:hypothetical protein
MIIADLQYVETIEMDRLDASAAEIVGGFSFWRPPSARAGATASAVAVGRNTRTFSGTLTESVAGLFSKSASVSYSSSRGLPLA